MTTMSVVTRFASGFSMKEDGKVTYIVPNSAKEDQFLPLDLTILQTEELGDTKKTGRKFYEAYKAEITEDSLRKQWKRNFSDSALNILKEALSGSECFKAGLVYEDNNWFLQIRSGDGKDEVGSIFLERIEIVPSVGRMLETVVISLMKASEESKMLRNKSLEVSTSRGKLESDLKNLVHEKAKMEYRYFKAFAKLLNTKKARIRELEAEIRKLKKRAASQADLATCSSSVKRLKTATDRPFSVSSSGSEADEQEENTDYDSETDVHDSDNEDSTKKCAITLKPDENLSKEGPSTSCKRNLFSEEANAVKSNLKHKDSAKDVIGHESGGSQLESSEEMIIPSEPLRARREEEEAIKPSELPSSKKESQHYDQNDTNDTQYLAESESPKSDTKCIGNVAEVDSQTNYNDKQGSSDDILNQLFGLDSQ